MPEYENHTACSGPDGYPSGCKLPPQGKSGIANNLILALQKSLRLIEKNPNIGRPDPEDGTREWSIPNWPYIIPYRIKSENIEILRVWHTRRDKPETW